MKIDKIEARGMDVHEVYFGGKEATDRNQIDVVDAMIDLLENSGKAIGFICDMKSSMSFPTSKNYGKRFMKLAEEHPNYVKTVIINANPFIQLILKTIKKDMCFAGNRDAALKILENKRNA
jgi:hypothetical protein